MGKAAAARGWKSPGPATEPAGSGAAGKELRVLLADDSEAARHLMSVLLEGLGCSVDAVGDGEEAVEHVVGEHYDAVFMDVDMPGLDGLGAALEIRRMGGNRAAVPIIALSGFSIDIDSRPELASAFDRAVAKPIRRAELQRIVAAIAQGAVRVAGYRAEAPAVAEALATIDNAQQELIFGNLDSSYRQRLLRLAATDLAGLARELDRVLPDTPHLEVARLAHKIRGTAANFGATPLSHLAAGLEMACARSMPHDIRQRIVALRRAATVAVAALRAQARHLCRRPSVVRAKARG